MDTLLDWLVNLDPQFAFLLALPFAVAAVALIADGIRRGSRREQRDTTATTPRFKQSALGF